MKKQITVTTSREHTPAGKHDERVNEELARLGAKVLQVENLSSGPRWMTVILYEEEG